MITFFTSFAFLISNQFFLFEVVAPWLIHFIKREGSKSYLKEFEKNRDTIANARAEW